MRSEIIFPIIYLICLLIIVGPRFLDTSSSLKQLISNLGIWAIIVLAISVIYQGYHHYFPQ